MTVFEEETEESVGIPDYEGVNLTFESLRSKTGFCQNHASYNEASFDGSNSICETRSTYLLKILVGKKNNNPSILR